MVNIGPLAPICFHPDAVEVRRAIDDELVAHWCPGCEKQFPADWSNQPSLTELFHPGRTLDYDPDPMLSAWKRMEETRRQLEDERSKRAEWRWHRAIVIASWLLALASWTALWVRVFR